MAQVIKLKRSATSGKVPATTDLDLGEIAINTYDGKLFIKKDDGSESVVEIGSGGSSTGLEALDEGNGIGWRLIGRNPDNYGNIGYNAIDFSESNSSSSTNGATGNNSLAIGTGVEASGDYSLAFGWYTKSSGNYSLAMNRETESTQEYTAAFGYNSKAAGIGSFAANSSKNYGSYSASFNNTIIDAGVSNGFSIGNLCEVSSNYACAQGDTTKASALGSHAEGRATVTNGDYSHAEGYFTETTSTGDYSHAEGYRTKTTGQSSHAEGVYTIAQNNSMHAAGKYNIGTATDTIHETGIGTSDSDRKNAFEIYTDGKVVTPELTTTLIDDTNTTNKVLVTKEWVQANTSVSRTVEEFTGDGTTTSFTLSNTYTTGSETLVDVYVDGLLKVEGLSKDYTLSNGDTLDFNTAPGNGSQIIVKILG